MMIELQELYRQESVLFSRYCEGKISKKEYLSYMRPLDIEISRLEMEALNSCHASKKAFLLRFQKQGH